MVVGCAERVHCDCSQADWARADWPGDCSAALPADDLPPGDWLEESLRGECSAAARSVGSSPDDLFPGERPRAGCWADSSPAADLAEARAGDSSRADRSVDSFPGGSCQYDSPAWLARDDCSAERRLAEWGSAAGRVCGSASMDSLARADRSPRGQEADFRGDLLADLQAADLALVDSPAVRAKVVRDASQLVDWLADCLDGPSWALPVFREAPA